LSTEADAPDAAEFLKVPVVGPVAYLQLEDWQQVALYT